jgi:serine protease Do
MSYHHSDLPNHICAIGITELKSLLEDLSNGRNRAYLGIHGTTIPSDVAESLGVPAGAYITKTEMNSPAMMAGIQSGDIVTAIGHEEVSAYEPLIAKLSTYSPDDVVTLSIMRQGPTESISIDIEVTLGSATHN